MQLTASASTVDCYISAKQHSSIVSQCLYFKNRSQTLNSKFSISENSKRKKIIHSNSGCISEAVSKLGNIHASTRLTDNKHTLLAYFCLCVYMFVYLIDRSIRLKYFTRAVI